MNTLPRGNRTEPRYPRDESFDPEDRDHPLVLRYDPDPDWLKPLGLPPAPTQHEQARAQIAANAIDKAWNPQPWTSYSRNKNHYARRGRRYDERPDLYRYSIIPAAVDALAAAGLIENVTAPRDPDCGRQSIFRAMPALIGALGDAPPAAAKLKRRALIQLRDEQKQLIDFRDNERIYRMRGRLEGINEAISSFASELPPDIGQRHSDLLVIGDSCVNLSNATLHRIFNIDFKNGGRFYGHFVQGLPKEIRSQLTINGEPVAEPDYPAHHLRILHALEGLQLRGDPYDIPDPDWERSSVKTALLILINAPTRQKAMGAIMHKLKLPGAVAGRLVKELKRKHKPIEGYFHSGAGRWLQRLDSDMAEYVELGLIGQGVPVLPIHDSFIVPARHEGAAREQMAEAFGTVISKARGVSRKTKPDQRLSAKSTYTPVEASSPLASRSSSSPLPAVAAPLSSFAALPSSSYSAAAPPSSTVLLPLPSLASSASALFDAKRRITPLGRMAALAAKRRRSIQQEKLADLIGIRRSTLANILAGRFGASPQTAEYIAEVIAMTPAFERQPFLPGLAA